MKRVRNKEIRDGTENDKEAEKSFKSCELHVEEAQQYTLNKSTVLQLNLPSYHEILS